MSKDRLVAGFLQSKLSGSIKTNINDRQGINRFIETLRDSGCNTQKWKNIHRGHVSTVVDSWKSEGMSSGTIKNYMASVRKICHFYGNIKISQSTNSDFGIENRSYITNGDKSVPDEVYQKAIIGLNSGTRNQQAVSLIIQTARIFGTRLEESYKFTPKKDTSPDGLLVTISRGSKGGRERTFTMTSQQKQLAQRVKEFAGKKGNLIPNGWTEKSWRQYVYKEARCFGIAQGKCGASFHGFRHARMHEIYREICGFEPRIKYSSTAAFIAAARHIAGDAWQQFDSLASRTVTLQAGHGVDRNIYTQYLGSWKKQ